MTRGHAGSHCDDGRNDLFMLCLQSSLVMPCSHPTSAVVAVTVEDFLVGKLDTSRTQLCGSRAVWS